MKSLQPQSRLNFADAGFTLTELLVLLGILALLVVIRLPAMCRVKAPNHLIQCMNNCRQLGLAAQLYRADKRDAYPFGTRVNYGSQVLDATGWPMQLLRYSGGYTGAQPKVFLCPNEEQIAENWLVQLHYQANWMIIRDTDDRDTPIMGAQVRNPAIYWLFIEKGPWDSASVSPWGLEIALAAWNAPPGYLQYRRHSGGMTAAAADGHAEWLRTPPYQPGRPPPTS